MSTRIARRRTFPPHRFIRIRLSPREPRSVLCIASSGSQQPHNYFHGSEKVDSSWLPHGRDPMHRRALVRICVDLELFHWFSSLVCERQVHDCKNKLGLCPRILDRFLPMDDLLPLVHWDLNTDRTSKISFFGALPWIARNIQDAFGVAMTD